MVTTARIEPAASTGDIFDCIDYYLECDVNGDRAWTWDPEAGYWIARSFHGAKQATGVELMEMVKAKGALFSQRDRHIDSE